MNNTVAQELCKTCKLCIEVCPCNIIGLDGNGKVTFIPERESICLQCGQCMAICTTKAISADGLSYGKELLDITNNQLEYSDFINFISNRRSVRNFKDKAVPNDMIQKILDTISFAPYGSEPAKMHVTVVDKRATIASALPYISKFLDNIVNWIDNPVMSFIIKLKKGQETFNTIKNHLYPIAKSGNYKLESGDRITRNAPALLIFHAPKDAEEHTNNSLIYATYAILAAHAQGLGASMIGLVPAGINKLPEVRQIFQIPKKHEAIMSVIVGFPKYKYKRTIKRNTLNINRI